MLVNNHNLCHINAKKGEVDNQIMASTILFNTAMVHSLQLSENASRAQKHDDVNNYLKSLMP
ncbi:hypothetical protein EPI10_006817 [Gossypium australe]|uniref:Uncharacterized protein n=1 Tax=Gossypium australe TaxID=47621 RepID=A0A5B6WS64_9ROSI|nr:hypothetical protein EPI10_006817 [Gossypium australe]